MKRIRKIGLINPTTYTPSEKHMYDMYKRNISNYKPYLSSPLNLLTIAAHTPRDIDVRIIDENIEQIDFNENFDLVGLTAMSQQAFRAYEIAGHFRNRNIPVAMGGIHATVLPEEAAGHVDAVFVGEAEESWPAYLHDLKTGNEKKIYRNEKLFALDKALTPRYELIPYDLLKSKDNYIRLIPVEATRGCPHDCSFCIVPEYYGRTLRKKSLKQIVEEIRTIKQLKYDSLVLFVDDNLFASHPYSKALLRELIPLKINYIAQTDIRVASDPELLDLAYRSGCVLMLIGFESIDTGNLEGINRNNWKMKQVGTYMDGIKKIQKSGILVFGSFIIGFENDDSRTFEKIRDFVVGNNISAHFTILTALPGCRLYEQMKRENKFFRDVFWDDLSFYTLYFKHPNIDREMAEKGIVWLYDEVYNDENSLKRYRHMMPLFKELPERWV
ncbi:MAG: B12-binding domain-containing radical SAM protein [Bacteroidales bacterium]|nr:B12-binding domain-containing radical SAM protein [Bacteroidales bacterium]